MWASTTFTFTVHVRRQQVSLGQHRWHSIACFGWTQHRTPWSGNPGYWMFENARQHYFYWRSTIMALKLTLLFFLSVWHMGKTKTKFGQIINSSHSSIIHSDSKTVVNLDLLSKSPWRQIRRSTCIPLYCHDFIFFGQTRTEHLCCTLLTTTNYVTGVALKDRCDHTAMTKQLFNRYKISSQCFFHVISSKKIQQLAASGPWPTEHVVEMSLGARKYHTWDPENVGSF